MNSDTVLDDEIMMEEIECAIRRIKRGKSGGMDNISGEHLQHRGEVLQVWLKQVFNAIITFEEIPKCLKISLIKPIYKGRGKDPWRLPALEWPFHQRLLRCSNTSFWSGCSLPYWSRASLIFSKLPTSVEFRVEMPSLQPKRQP